MRVEIDESRRHGLAGRIHELMGFTVHTAYYSNAPLIHRDVGRIAGRAGAIDEIGVFDH